MPHCVPADKRGWAYGITTSASALGLAVGSPLGGLISGFLNWRYIFYLNIPLLILAVILAKRVIPADSPGSDGAAKQAFDWRGAFLSFTAIFLLIYAVNRGTEEGWTSSRILGAFICSLLTGILFIIFEKRKSSPLLELSLFRSADFSLCVLAGCLGYFFLSANFFLLPFYIEEARGMAAHLSGFVILAFSAGFLPFSAYAGKISDRVNPRIICAASMGSALLCCMFFTFTLHFDSLLYAVAFLVWLGASYAFFFSPNNNLLMTVSPSDKHGAASGIYTTFTVLSSALGVCFFETVFSEVAQHTGSLRHAALDRTILIKGFFSDYLLASGVFLLAFCAFLLLILRWRARSRNAEPDAAPTPRNPS